MIGYLNSGLYSFQDFQDLPEGTVGHKLRLLAIFRREELQHKVDFLLGRGCAPVADYFDRFPLARLADVRVVFVGDLGIGAEDGEQSGLGDARLGAEARETMSERMEAVQ